MRGLLRVLAFLLVLASLGGAGWYANSRYQQQTVAQIPLATAHSGEFLAVVSARGELKAERSAQVYVPLMPNLRIAWMAPAGELVQQGDPVVRFDSTSGQQDIIQKRAAVTQAQAALDQATSQGTITAEHDQADLKDGQFQVELAEIKMATNEFVPRLDAERNKIDLDTAVQKLRALEATVNQHVVSDKAKLASLKRQLDFAKAELEIAESRLQRLELPAPLGGFWIVNPNYQGTTSQPFKVGDAVTGGMSIAVIPDMTSLMLDVKIEEIDRGRIRSGADVRIKVDAVPELTISAKLTAISPLAELSLEGVISRSFRGYAAIPNPDPRLRPGMNGGMDIVIDRLPNAISVPTKAVFTRAGKPVVYLSEGEGRFRAVAVEVVARNTEEAAINGLMEGAIVALVEPASEAKRP
jgi:HlyD family secretion protein